MTYELPKVEFKANLIREPLKYKSDDWQESSHHWVVTINGQSFDYYTGLAHREPKRFREQEDDFKRLRYKSNLTQHGFEALLRASTPTTPNFKNVLYSLVMDSEATTMSFQEWCDSLGYDADSRKALAIYEACQNNTDKLRKAGITVDNDLREYFQDY